MYFIECCHTTLGSIVINLVVEYPLEVFYLQFHTALNELYWCIIITSIHMLLFALFFILFWSAMFWINQRCIRKSERTIIILVIYSIKIGARQIKYYKFSKKEMGENIW